MLSFYAHRSQKRKKVLDLTVFFALLGSLLVKAAHKMLMKLTPGVNPSKLKFVFLALQVLLLSVCHIWKNWLYYEMGKLSIKKRKNDLFTKKRNLVWLAPGCQPNCQIKAYPSLMKGWQLVVSVGACRPNWFQMDKQFSKWLVIFLLFFYSVEQIIVQRINKELTVYLIFFFLPIYIYRTF